MSETVLQMVESPEAQRAAVRSRAFALFAEAARFPDPELLGAIRSGAVARALEATLSELDAGLGNGVAWESLADAGPESEDEDLAVEHTRLFEVGTSGPPCALYGGLYGDARMKTMEEAVRFYNHFGLTLAEDPRELPDHLETELEFLHYLAFREAEAVETGADPGPYQRAQRDFVERHPGRWVPKLVQRLQRAQARPYYATLFTLLARFLAREAAVLRAVAGPPAAS
jgi:DMSO reductase family type II enzyme chaperone